MKKYLFHVEVNIFTIYESLVRSHFDYGMSVWTPHLVKYIKAIERVQRRATKMIPTIKDLSYSERLKKLKLPTLAYRRARGDMIEVYKIVTDIYDPKTTSNLFKIRGKRIYEYLQWSMKDCIHLIDQTFLLKENAAYFNIFFIMDENDALSEYNKIPLGHNRTNGAIYSKIYFEVEICSAH